MSWRIWIPSAPFSRHQLRTASAVARSTRRRKRQSFELRWLSFSSTSASSSSRISLSAAAAGATSASSSSRGAARMVQQVSLAASSVPSGGINFAARRGDDGIAQLLVRRAFGVAAGVHHLQNKQTHQQPAKAQGRHRCGKHPRAGADVPVQPRQHRTRRAALPPFSSSHHAAPLPPSICEKSGAVCPFCVIQAKRARRSWL